MYVSELQPGQRAFIATASSDSVMVQRPDVGEYEAFTGREGVAYEENIVLRNLETNRWMFLDKRTACWVNRR